MKVTNKIQHNQLCNKCLNLTIMVNDMTVSQALDYSLLPDRDDIAIIVAYNRILCGLERKGGCQSCISLFAPYRLPESQFNHVNGIK